MTPEQQAILDILEDSKLTSYNENGGAQLSLSPTAIDRIKDLFAKQK